MRLHFLVLMLSIAAAGGFAADNVIPNAGFEEGAGVEELPRGWLNWVPMPGPKTGVATDHKRSGNHSAFIRTDTDSIAFLMSTPVPVAPGEKLRLSAWCRTEDMSSTSAGTFGIAAGWMDLNKTYLRHADYTTVPVESRPEWFHVKADVVTPPGAAYVAFQLRHRAVSGKSWWDDLEMNPETSVALRLAFVRPTLEPGHTTVPAILINRDPLMAKKKVTLRATPGNIGQEIELSPELESTVTIHVNATKRGPETVSVHMIQDEASFVNASAKVTVPEQLVTEPVLPVYSCIEDSPAEVEARVWVHEPEETRKDLFLKAALRRAKAAANEKAIAQAETTPTAIENRLKFKVPPLAQLGRGDYDVTIQLLRGSAVVSEATHDWHVISRAEAMTTFSEDGFPVVNGRKMFPMGLYDGANFEELAAAGFNVTQNFDVGYVRRGSISNNDRMKRVLDDTVAAGMHHLFLVTHGTHARVLDEEHLRRVMMFKNHPGILTWNEEEGVARGEVPLSFLKELRETMTRLAPEHPLVIGDTIDAIGKMSDRSNFFPVEYMDGGIWWWYPFPIRKGGRPGAYEGEEIGQGLELVPPSFLTMAKTKKPIWVALQSYKKDNGRFPTKAEYRAQPYVAVIHNAKGVFWYTGSYTGGVQLHPEEGNYEYLKKVVRELREMSPVFMSPDAKDEVKLAEKNELISFRMKDAGEKRVLLAVNRNDRPTTVTFQVPGLKAGNVPVRFESRAVKTEAGRLSDGFDGYGVHVYEIPK